MIMIVRHDNVRRALEWMLLLNVVFVVGFCCCCC